MTRRKIRRDLINSLKRELMGPFVENEIIQRVPIQQYLTGIIYPEITNEEGPLDEQDDSKDKDDEEEEIYSKINLPRSIGLSSIIEPDLLGEKGIDIGISGAIYEEESPQTWKRFPISEKGDEIIIPQEKIGIKFSEMKESRLLSLEEYSPLSKKLREIELVWETVPLKNKNGEETRKWYLSVFLINKKKSKKIERASKSLYQVYLSIRTVDSWAIAARDESNDFLDEELKTLSLLYMNNHEFAVGHQTSANWDSGNLSDSKIITLAKKTESLEISSLPKNNLNGDFLNHCQMVETTFFPEYRSRTMDWSIEGISLNMYELSNEGLFTNGIDKKNHGLHALKELANQYNRWILQTFSDSNKEKYKIKRDIFESNYSKCNACLKKINDGIELIEGDEEVYKAFCLMNRAMWLNSVNKEQSKNKKWPYVMNLNDKSASWRPFQMAFILQVIPSLSREKIDRDTVDLLWAPTGSGKTEAYLGLIAFTLFLNRIRGKAKQGDGLEVMMRYTLRLLTIQQFQRAARLIVACEHIRKWDRYKILNNCKPFSIGLYVGQNTTPNKISTNKRDGRYADDYHLYKAHKNDEYNEFDECKGTAEFALVQWREKGSLPEESNPVQILNCPWCGQELTHRDYKIINREKMEIYCSFNKCPFSREDMPLRIYPVDQSIMDDPPSLLIGTVDKFAQLPFNPKIGRLFGWDRGKRIGHPPTLIIQDELHLINGPLGSMVGLYEASIDYLSCEGLRALDIENATMDGLTQEKKIECKTKPKIIASTATIRNADRQCRNLYDRKAKQFPPPGLTISDSFFVKERADNRDDKSYVGIYCPGIGMKTTNKRCLSVLLSENAKFRDEGVEGSLFDPYWTIVSYFNSRRELGGAVSLIRDDVRTNVRDVRPSIESENSLVELHGGLDSTKLPDILSKLERTVQDTSSIPYDILLCTNMFSVGIDIDRLGLMLMNCQPKATTEYLQSTGRVGRKGDGLVITLFNQARPRDLSHFESFYDYHQRIQHHVESMTVTPFSEGSIDRSLHAQYVAMMRITFPQCSLDSILDNTACINFSDAHINYSASLTICLFLLHRAKNVDKSDKLWSSLLESLKYFQREWIRRRNDALDNPIVMNGKPTLLYIEKSKIYQRKYPRLLEQDPASPWFDSRKFGKYHPPILTPNSLRNVEEEIALVELWRKRND